MDNVRGTPLRHRLRQLDPWARWNLAYRRCWPEFDESKLVPKWERNPVHRPLMCRHRRICPACGWLDAYQKAFNYVELFRSIGTSQWIYGKPEKPSLWAPTLTLPNPYRRTWTMDRFARVVEHTLKRWGTEALGGEVGFLAHYDTLSTSDPVGDLSDPSGGLHLHVQLAGPSILRLALDEWGVRRGYPPRNHLAKMLQIYKEEITREAGEPIPRTETNPNGGVHMYWRPTSGGDWRIWARRITDHTRGAPVLVCDALRDKKPPEGPDDPMAVRVRERIEAWETQPMARAYGWLAECLNGTREEKL